MQLLWLIVMHSPDDDDAVQPVTAVDINDAQTADASADMEPNDCSDEEDTCLAAKVQWNSMYDVIADDNNADEPPRHVDTVN